MLGDGLPKELLDCQMKEDAVNFFQLLLYFSLLCFLPFIYIGDVLLLDADVRLARRIRRDTVERGRDINSVLEQVSTYAYYIFCPQLVK